jgi:hypothetical protein
MSALLCSAVATGKAPAQGLGSELSGKLTVVSTRTVERVEGANGKTWSTKDASKLKGLVLLVQVPANTRLFCADLTLMYDRDGKGDRSRCIAVGIDASGAGVWFVDEYASFTSERGGTLLVLFPIETDVREVALAAAQRTGPGIAIRRE